MPDDWSPLDTPRGGRLPWFTRKRIGVGWSPRTWQGYLITSGAIAAIEAVTIGTRAPWAYLAAAFPLVLFAIKTAAGWVVRRPAPRRIGRGRRA
jgi:hypothetical protein